MKSKVNVITAGPSAGKSSIIRELSARGYRTLPEAARILFDQNISEGTDPADVRARPDFHDQVEHIDRWIESNLAEMDEPVFLDRSLADNIAYRRHNDEPVENWIVEECRERYDTIFLLDRIEFEDDDVRDEDPQEAQELHEELRQVYTDLGYDIHEIEVCPLDLRADMIVAEIERAPPIH